MADVRVNQLPLATGPTAPMQSDFVPIDGTNTRKATLLSLADVINPPASQAEAEAGIDAVKRMTPLLTAQAIAVQAATPAQGLKADGAAQKAGNLSDLSDAATARTNLGLGTAATKDSGRLVGNAFVFEDTDGGGFPTLVTDSRFIVRKGTPALNDPWTLGALRKTDGLTGGTYGNVTHNILSQVDVTTSINVFQWAMTGIINLSGAAGGQHVGVYAQGNKNADGTLWALCTEIRDHIVNPTTGTISAEIGIFVSGTDDNNNRIGIDVSIGSHNGTAGTNIINAALRIGPSENNPALAQFKKGIEIKGHGTVGIDLTGLNIAYSDHAIDMTPNAKLSWGTSADLQWNSTISTWAIGGVPLIQTTSPAAGGAGALPATPRGYWQIALGTLGIINIPYY